MPNSSIKVFIVEDHFLIRNSLTEYLSKSDKLILVGFATDGESGLRAVESLDIDLLLLDIDLPKLNGLALLDLIRAFNDKIKIVMLSQHEEKAIIEKSKQLGANGYILKSSDLIDFNKGIQIILEGDSYFPEAPNSLKKSKLEIHNRTYNLTKRERQVLQLISEGYTNKSIGEKLFTSHKTIDVHRTNLMRKLGVKNVASLVKESIKAGLIDLD